MRLQLACYIPQNHPYHQVFCEKSTDYTDYRVRYIILEDNVNVIFRDGITDSVICVISVIGVWHVGSMLMQPGEYRNTIS